MELSELDLGKTLLFFFSAIGVLNTFFLALYFTLFIKNGRLHNRFLAALLIVIGLRETKSVLVLFLEQDEFLAFFGQLADTLIGPFLYLYVTTYTSEKVTKRHHWITHTLTYVVLMVGIFHLIAHNHQPYTNYSSEIGGIIYIQWITYISLSMLNIKEVIKELFNGRKLQKKELWLVTIVGSVFVIWLAYLLTHYGNYVLGGVSVSAVLYLSMILWLYGRKSEFYEVQPKYENKKITDDEAKRILAKLNDLMVAEEQYIDADVKLADIAAKLDISTHLISQILNDNLQINFKHYINRFRIQAATQMIKKNHQITLEAIGIDSGFKSKSSFYSAFKSIQGETPAQYRKKHISN